MYNTFDKVNALVEKGKVCHLYYFDLNGRIVLREFINSVQ